MQTYGATGTCTLSQAGMVETLGVWESQGSSASLVLTLHVICLRA